MTGGNLSMADIQDVFRSSLAPIAKSIEEIKEVLAEMDKNFAVHQVQCNGRFKTIEKDVSQSSSKRMLKLSGPYFPVVIVFAIAMAIVLSAVLAPAEFMGMLMGIVGK